MSIVSVMEQKNRGVNVLFKAAQPVRAELWSEPSGSLDPESAT